MADWVLNADDQSGRLVVDGGLTVAQVGELKEELLHAFEEAATVTFDITAVEETDIAGLQLICAGHRYAVKQGKLFKLVFADGSGFGAVLKEAGFQRELVCNTSGGEECLWEDVE